MHPRLPPLPPGLAAIIAEAMTAGILTGWLALLIFLPLAVTSNDLSVRKLGRRWKALHRLVYVIAILGVWHYWWQVKQDITEPAIYAVILVTVLLLRWPPVGRYVWRGHGKRMRVPTPTQKHSTARGLKL